MKLRFKLGLTAVTAACALTGTAPALAGARAATKPMSCAPAVSTALALHARRGFVPEELAGPPTTGSGTIGPYDYDKAEAYREDILSEGGQARMYDASADLFDLAYSYNGSAGC